MVPRRLSTFLCILHRERPSTELPSAACYYQPMALFLCYLSLLLSLFITLIIIAIYLWPRVHSRSLPLTPSVLFYPINMFYIIVQICFICLYALYSGSRCAVEDGKPWAKGVKRPNRTYGYRFLKTTDLGMFCCNCPASGSSGFAGPPAAIAQLSVLLLLQSFSRVLLQSLFNSEGQEPHWHWGVALPHLAPNWGKCL